MNLHHSGLRVSDNFIPHYIHFALLIEPHIHVCILRLKCSLDLFMYITQNWGNTSKHLFFSFSWTQKWFPSSLPSLTKTTQSVPAPRVERWCVQEDYLVNSWTQWVSPPFLRLMSPQPLTVTHSNSFGTKRASMRWSMMMITH